MGTFHIDASKFGVNSIVNSMVVNDFKQFSVFVRISLQNFKGMQQQPGKFGIVTKASVIGSVPFLSLFRKTIPAPNDVKFYLGSNRPIFEELWYPGLINRMDDFISV